MQWQWLVWEGVVRLSELKSVGKNDFAQTESGPVIDKSVRAERGSEFVVDEGR